MQLRHSTIDQLALMICGDQPYSFFPYRSSSYLTHFFRDIDLKYEHDGSTRKWWVSSVLEELNAGKNTDPDLPADGIKLAIEFLLDPVYFGGSKPLDHTAAIDAVNKVLESEGLFAEKDRIKGSVTICKLVEGFISTDSESIRSKRVITFIPSVFDIPVGSVDENLVSVMMPFEMAFDAVLDAIKKSCADVGMKCHRADDIWESSTIIQDIFKLIYSSSIVIVDFSGKNPNVFYEAGISHTLGKNVIPIAQNLDEVPFDLRHHRVLIYLNNGEGLSELGENLKKRLRTLRQAM